VSTGTSLTRTGSAASAARSSRSLTPAPPRRCSGARARVTALPCNVCSGLPRGRSRQNQSGLSVGRRAAAFRTAAILYVGGSQSAVRPSTPPLHRARDERAGKLRKLRGPWTPGAADPYDGRGSEGRPSGPAPGNAVRRAAGRTRGEYRPRQALAVRRTGNVDRPTRDQRLDGSDALPRRYSETLTTHRRTRPSPRRLLACAGT